MAKARYSIRTSLLAASALAGSLVLALSTPVAAQEKSYQLDLPSQPLSQALMAFGSSTDRQIVFSEGLVKGRTAPPLHGDYTASQALAMLLAGSGLTAQANADGVILVQKADDPQSGSAAGDGADQGTVQALIVTAQKREEQIQDVPIAISAFSQKALEEQKIEGGFDLLKAIPNVTFSKNNFSGYNFSIRGVGTKAISATTDPGVAVAFNNTTLIQNRLFEQEYFDVERVEVLRGPQGTLYGRNATSGVINVISAKPKLGQFEASAKVEIGNYDARRFVGMVNIPLVEDVLAVRLAGSMTQRSGYDYNEITGNNINGRDLWSGRITIGFQPTPRLRGNLLWEHFNEDDNRSRTGKQLCHRDPGPDFVGSEPTASAYFAPLGPALFSQACKPGSLYDDAAFGAPNGLAMPFIFAALMVPNCIQQNPYRCVIKHADPYAGLDQSRDLRTIASVRDPIYRAKADVFDLSFDFDITDSLTLTSQTVRNTDQVYSFQDFNRFNSFPAFTNTTELTTLSALGDYRLLAPGGVFCDPQIGCTDRVAGFDISQAKGKQFSQELRLSSDFDGPVNFSAGANYTTFETLVDYYVMYNLLTALAMTPPFNENRNMNGVIDPTVCAYSADYYPFFDPGGGVVSIDDPTANCIYIDPNPVESINGEGHNYFRSENPYKLKSQAVFGEVYWKAAEDLKVTAGLRYTKDRKTFTPVPSQVLLAPGLIGGGTVSRGYPAKPDIVQEWGEWTGRLGIDWKPALSFTDETMLYAFYSHGYKGGGANPPSPGFATLDELVAFLDSVNASENWYTVLEIKPQPILSLNAVEYGPTFEPEFVDALEIGAKNTLLGGAMTLNATAFYYDYKDYQVSQIRDRTAVNENFDATIWGLEFETVFAPSRDFRINANLGYLDTRIADGETSIDIMNRTQGNPDYMVVKPWMQLPSNCVVPTAVVERFLSTTNAYDRLCGGLGGLISGLNGSGIIDPNPLFGGGTSDYDFRNYPELNGGAGLKAQLGGNELPNAPHWTTNIGAQYGRDVLGGSWRVIMRGDAYWQSQSWARVYNAVNDKLHGWYNLNVSVRLVNEDLGLEGEFYVKNLLDKSPITDAFLNSDDSGLTTNVFVLDPRLVGFSLRKTF
jgi:outer membrane receptor protein involved in Fe transport